jgi:hypothetical protein
MKRRRLDIRKSLAMPEEQQPRNTMRADIVMSDGFGLEVDGRIKTKFPTKADAEKSAMTLKSAYPMLQVKVYDAAEKTRTLMELPINKVGVT